MYAESWMRRREVRGLNMENLKEMQRCGTKYQGALTPPEILEAQEEGTRIMSMLHNAVTEDERRLIRLLDRLVDRAWMFTTGKGLRGELRKMWKRRGMSEWRFYMAFNAVEQREFK